MGSRRYVVTLLKLIISICFIIKDTFGSTLTTAVARESTSPKPSTIHRRINVDRNAALQSNSPIQLFHIADTRRRNSKKHVSKNFADKVWSWDYFCSLQAKVGSCDKNIHRIYYDRQLEECKTFNYSGCNGNKNNFETLLECKRRCSGATSMMQLDTRRQLICSLQPETGRCFAYDIQYYFNINTKKCAKYYHGGCGSNGNSFNTKFECMKTCGGETY